MPFLIVQGDIAAMKTDAIVNSADTTLLSGGAVFERVHKAAGRGLRRACAALNGCAAGEAKITEACKLPCRYVIHTVCPVWQGGQNGEEELLASCYRNTLRLAAEKGCSSVAFPLLSAGSNGYPKERALRAAKEAIAAFLQERELDVYLIIFDRMAVFQNDLRYRIVWAYYLIPWSGFQEILPFYKELYYSIFESWSNCSDYFQSIADEYHYCWYHNKSGLDHLDGPSSKIFYETKTYFPRNEEAEDKDVKENHSAGPDEYDWSTEAFNHLPVLLRHVFSVADYNDSSAETWTQMLLRLMSSKGFSCEQCAARANISSSYLRSLCFEAGSLPSKYTALALAIALELSVAETGEMLAKLGVMWQRCDLFEVITEFYISKGIYDIHCVNLALFAYKQRLLGRCDIDFDESQEHERNCSRNRSFDGKLKDPDGCLDECAHLVHVCSDENADSNNEIIDAVKYSDDGKMLLSADKKVTSVTVPAGVILIDECAFKNCRSLKAVSLPDSIEQVDHNAFSGCSALTSIRLPVHLSSVSDYLFGNCWRLTEVELPDDLAEIGSGAFFNCNNLLCIKLPSRLKIIENDAFWNCRKLEISELSSYIERIGSSAFYSCQALCGHISLPFGLTVISDNTFMNCSGITSVTLPAKVNYIGRHAFADCSSLVSVDLPEVKVMKVFAETVASDQSMRYFNDKVDWFAFWNCRQLTSVHLPKGITVIGYCAFGRCESLREINIPDTVTEIEGGAFLGCRNLEALVIPDSVSKIAADAFEGVPCVVYNGTAEGAPWGAGKVTASA
ncbi:MAG: leucine-rich repeat protein [bacterium]|nr:leucine-rich repeat protein [bacterium]